MKIWSSSPKTITAFGVALALVVGLSLPPSARAATNGKTFSVVVSPKMISDFNNPLPSVQTFYNNYQGLMSQYSSQLVGFYVSAGDHIYSYPANAFALDPQQALRPTVQSIYNGAPISFWLTL